MAAVGRDEVRVLARLARLSLSPAEADRFGDQLGEILGYIEQLAAVSVDGVPEYLAAEQPGSRLRPDTPVPSLDPEQALAAAPAQRGGMVVVPKFKED